MGDKTAIQWTERTWNPWMGCHKVSPGCAHCYMFREQERYGNDPNVVRRSKTTFTAPLRWKEPALVFTCSWSDWFVEEADEWRPEAWEIVRQTPHLTYQILTKRPERITDHLPDGQPFPNVWLGVSAENQRWADARIPVLLNTPAAVRFVSAEPLLGPIDLHAYTHVTGLDWVICGGESGAGHRPMNLDWARSIRDECVTEGVPFFFKQVGGVRPTDGGRLLDGREWNEMPVSSLVPIGGPDAVA